MRKSLRVNKGRAGKLMMCAVIRVFKWVTEILFTAAKGVFTRCIMRCCTNDFVMGHGVFGLVGIEEPKDEACEIRRERDVDLVKKYCFSWFLHRSYCLEDIC